MSRLTAICAAIGLGLGLSGCSFLVDTSPCKPSDCNPGYVCGPNNVCVPESGSSSASSGSTSTSTTSGSSSASSGTVSSTSSSTSSGSTGTSSTSGTSTGSGSSGATGSGSSSGSTSGGAILILQPTFAGGSAQVWACEPGKTIPSTLNDSPTGSGTPINATAAGAGAACAAFQVPSSWSPGPHLFVDPATGARASFIKLATSPFQAPSGSSDWSQSGNNFLSGAVIYDPGFPPLALVGESDPNLPLLTLAGQLPATAAGNPTGLPQLPVELEPFSALGPTSSDRQALVYGASGTLAVVSIDSLGQLTFESQLPTSTLAPFVSAGDLDGDGVAELVRIGTSGPAEIGRLNSPSRPLSYSFGPLGASIHAVGRGALADVDHDGSTDLVAWGSATDGGAAFQVVAGTPTGLGTAVTPISVGSGTPIGRPVVFNLPPQNDPEASVAAATQGGGIWVVRNPLSGSPTAEFVPTDGEVSGLAAGDLDGDGVPELVVVERNPNDSSLPDVLKVFHRTTSGFAALPGHMTLSPGTILLGLLDIDGDSRLDIGLASISTGHVVYLTGRGEPVVSSLQPSFGGPNALTFLTGQWSGQAFAVQPTDLDGGPVTTPVLAATLSPSRAYLAVGGLPGSGPYRLPAAGIDGGPPIWGPEFDLLEAVGGVASPHSGAAPPPGATCATLGHFRSTGPGLDLLVASPAANPPASIYWEDGSLRALDTSTGLDLGQLGPPDGGGAAILHPFGCAAIDLNHDGLDDVVVVSNERTISSLWNQDNEAFEASHVDSMTTSGVPTRAAFADLDGDGLIDVAVAQPPANITAYLQSADGTFHAAGSIASLSVPVDSLAAGDFNGDGHEDLAAMLDLPDGGGRQVELYLAGADQLPHESSPAMVVSPSSGGNFNASLAAGPLYGLPRDQLVFSDISSAAMHYPKVVDLLPNATTPTVSSYIGLSVGDQVAVVSLPSQSDAGYPDAVAAFWTPGSTGGWALASLEAGGAMSLRTIYPAFASPYGQILAGPVSSRSKLDFVNVPPGPTGGATVEQIPTLLPDGGP